MAIDATVAGPQSNSYVTLAEAAAYFAGRLHSSAWDNATPQDQVKALLTATRTIELVAVRLGPPPASWSLVYRSQRIPWNPNIFGYAAEAGQVLKFPRYWDRHRVTNTLQIPVRVREAQLEIALWLLSKTSDQIQRESLQAQGVREFRLGSDLHEIYGAGAGEETPLPQAARELLMPFLMGAVSIR